MATWGVESSVTYAVEIAFGDDPWATTPTYTDVSSYVRNIQTFRGSTSEDLVISPGSMRLTLDNRARTFDNDYASGPYFGTVLPMRRVRFTATRAAVTFVVFTGWITGWQQDWGHRDGVAYADVVDGGYFAQNETLAANAYEAEVLADSPVAYWPLTADTLDMIGDADLVDIQLAGRVPATFAETTAPLGAATAWFGGDPSSVYQTGTTAYGSLHALEAWFTIVRGQGVSVVSYAAGEGYIEITYDSTAEWLRVGYENADDNVGLSTTVVASAIETGVHHVAVHATATTLTLLIDGQTAATHTFAAVDAAVTDSYTFITSHVGTAISGIALYTTAPSLARLTAHANAGVSAHGHPTDETGGDRIERVLDEIEYPANLRDIDPGGTVQGAYLPNNLTAMDYVYQVLASERGLVCWSADGKFTFRDRHWQQVTADADAVVFSDDGGAGSIGYTAGSPASSTIDTVRNIVTVSYSDVGAITRRDATSITAYGPSREFVDAPTLRNGTDASNLAAYVLREKKDPTPKIPRLTVQLREDIATNFAKILGLELGEVVTVERTPMGVGSQIVKRYQVRAIAHSVTPAEWVTEFYMSPAVEMADEAPYWTIAHATYGRVGAPAGNKIPF